MNKSIRSNSKKSKSAKMPANKTKKQKSNIQNKNTNQIIHYPAHDFDENAEYYAFRSIN